MDTLISITLVEWYGIEANSTERSLIRIILKSILYYVKSFFFSVKKIEFYSSRIDAIALMNKTDVYNVHVERFRNIIERYSHISFAE